MQLRKLLTLSILTAFMCLLPMQADAMPFFGQFEITIFDSDFVPINSKYTGTFSYNDANLTNAGAPGQQIAPLKTLDFTLDGFNFPLKDTQFALAEYQNGTFKSINYGISNYENKPGEFVYVDWVGVTQQYLVFDAPHTGTGTPQQIRYAYSRVAYSEPRPVPEPSTLMLFGVGAIGMFVRKKRA